MPFRLPAKRFTIFKSPIYLGCGQVFHITLSFSVQKTFRSIFALFSVFTTQLNSEDSEGGGEILNLAGGIEEN
jgi:hypothetical protein